MKWIYEPTPEFARVWQSQGTSFGFDGYVHLKEILAALVSQATVQLTINVFDGLPPAAVTLPNTAGQYQKVLLPFTPNKGLLYTFQATSAAPFQLYEMDCEILVKPWGASGPYTRYRGFGAPHGAGATI